MRAESRTAWRGRCAGNDVCHQKLLCFLAHLSVMNYASVHEKQWAEGNREDGWNLCGCDDLLCCECADG
jgi:hypothetical protein